MSTAAKTVMVLARSAGSEARLIKYQWQSNYCNQTSGGGDGASKGRRGAFSHIRQIKVGKKAIQASIPYATLGSLG